MRINRVENVSIPFFLYTVELQLFPMMYSELLGSIALCETTSVTGSTVSTGAKLAIASGPSLSLGDTSVYDQVREVLRANTLYI